jgi:ABC-2 type transport system permease protein
VNVKTIRKYRAVVRVSLSNAIAYRADVYMRLGFYALLIYVMMSLWRAIYQEGDLHGYSFVQIVWYLIMTEFIFFAGGSSVFRGMNEEVKSGSIAYFIGRPTHYVWYQFANSLGQVAFWAAVFGLLAAALGFAFAGPLYTFRPEGVPAMLLSLSLGITLHFFFMMLLGLSAFVMEENFALYLLYSKLTFMLGMILPVEFLPLWLQPIAKSLPFSYVFWAPAKLFVDYSPGLFLTLFPRQLMWVAVTMAAVFAVYHVCVKRLQVNGG